MHVVQLIHVEMEEHAEHYQVVDIIVHVQINIMEEIVKIVKKILSKYSVVQLI